MDKELKDEFDKLNNKIDNKIDGLASKMENGFIEVGEQIQGLANHIDRRFNEMDEKFNEMDEKFNGLDAKVNGLDIKINGLDTKMVTKEYLDDKLANFAQVNSLKVRDDDEEYSS